MGAVAGLGATLAHEVKNPLSGIRGAAQLIEGSLAEDERPLVRLICDETDRICALVEPAIREAEQPERPAFAQLDAETAELTREPSGVGLDTPPWLAALEEDYVVLRFGNDMTAYRAGVIADYARTLYIEHGMPTIYSKGLAMLNGL